MFEYLDKPTDYLIDCVIKLAVSILGIDTALSLVGCEKTVVGTSSAVM